MKDYCSFSVLWIAIILVWLPSDAKAQNEEEAVLSVVSSVFDGINTKDRTKIEAAMASGSVLFSTGMNNGLPYVNPQTAAQFSESVANSSALFLERMFETEVKIQQGVALVWANYDFHRNGMFSHCGVDTFTLVKTAAGWKVASLAYTVERTGCPERPVPVYN